jgi:iron(III) transport system permease protein
MVFNSLVFAFGSAVFALITGTVLAYLQVRTDVPFKILFFVASLVPLVIPGILYTISWILIASPEIGILRSVLDLPVLAHFSDVFSLQGMVWVQGLHLSPIVFLLMTAAFRSMDPSLEESALMCGAGWFRMLRLITAPLMRPAAVAAMLVMIVQSLESFEVPALLGLRHNIYVFTSQIYFVLRRYPPDMAVAGALALGLLVLAFLGILLSNRLGNRGRAYQTITGKGFRPRPIELGRFRPIFGAGILLYFFVTIVVPFLVLLYAALLPYYQRPKWGVHRLFTLDNFREIFNDKTAIRAARNSLVLGVTAAGVVMVLAAIAGWIVVRSKIRGRGVLDQLASLPLVFPGLVLGLAISFVYLRLPIQIYGTLLILLVGYCTRFLPYGMRYSVTSMHQVGTELEESAEVCGATWFYSFRRIVFPLVAPGLLAGFVYVMVVSFRELSTSILLYTPGNEVLSIKIFEQYEDGQFPQLAALGVLMILALMVMVSVAYRVGARVGLRSE